MDYIGIYILDLERRLEFYETECNISYRTD